MSTFIKLNKAISCTQAHTYLLGDVDETPCLPAGFSYLLANLLDRIKTMFNGACLFFFLESLL